MKRLQTSLLQGTLDLMVLRVVSAGPRHGYDIAKRIEVLSRDILSIGQGSLYPALHRLEERGFVKATWKMSETGRRARFYALTAAGKRELTASEDYWRAFSTAVEHVLKGADA
ncbi:PadR family transcriptional regulator [Synoicihabitans lomoniglobus]|uniref:PadR family transcriptional regulator n=1 Tax=Synoicihabitans lomoniglobus TaxID=2909285 RepID=A0AAF0A1K0_9BACT|nr:PadR family transcriptional regulator [Opitutaceae bacterium LMO-M01]WED65092.1 PadR family transcriptional regulator [Opitutaceae bacterium LMO-M01]